MLMGCLGSDSLQGDGGTDLAVLRGLRGGSFGLVRFGEGVYALNLADRSVDAMASVELFEADGMQLVGGGQVAAFDAVRCSASDDDLARAFETDTGAAMAHTTSFPASTPARSPSTWASTWPIMPTSGPSSEVTARSPSRISSRTVSSKTGWRRTHSTTSPPSPTSLRPRAGIPWRMCGRSAPSTTRRTGWVRGEAAASTSMRPFISRTTKTRPHHAERLGFARGRSDA